MEKRFSEIIHILVGYKVISVEGPYFVRNTDLRSLYQNLPWEWINHLQKRISKFEKKKLNWSGYVELGGKRLNEKARTVL